MTVNGIGFFQNDENVITLDSGNGCIHLCDYTKKPLNCAL